MLIEVQLRLHEHLEVNILIKIMVTSLQVHLLNCEHNCVYHSKLCESLIILTKKHYLLCKYNKTLLVEHAILIVVRLNI